ncbi:MAG: hypothetical protein QW273_02890 [Candidatus Pacearchaeota archaeon]
MKIEINIEKNHLIIIVLFIFLVSSFFVYAYNSGVNRGNPQKMGHSVDEIDWSKQIQGNLNVSGTINANRICIGSTCKDSLDSSLNERIIPKGNLYGYSCGEAYKFNIFIQEFKGIIYQGENLSEVWAGHFNIREGFHCYILYDRVRKSISCITVCIDTPYPGCWPYDNYPLCPEIVKYI